MKFFIILLALSLIDINQNKIAGTVTSGFNISISSAHADEAAQTAEEKKAAAIKAKAAAAEKLAAVKKAKAEDAKAKAEAAKIAKAAAAVKAAAAKKAKAEAALIAKAAAAVKAAAAKKAKAEAAIIAKAAAAEKAAAADAAEKAADQPKIDADEAEAEDKRIADAVPECSPNSEEDVATKTFDEPKSFTKLAASPKDFVIRLHDDTDEEEVPASDVCLAAHRIIADDGAARPAVDEPSIDEEKDPASKDKFNELISINKEKDPESEYKITNTIEADFYILAFNYSRKDLLTIPKVTEFLRNYTDDIKKQCELYNKRDDLEFKHLQGLGVIDTVQRLIKEDDKRKCHSKSLKGEMFKYMEQAADS